MPDSLGFNADSTDYFSNPIEMHWGQFFKSGWLPIRLTHTELRYPAVSGFRLDDATPASWDGDTLLYPGDTLLFFYRLYVEGRSHRRLPLIGFRTSDGGSNMGEGEHYVIVPALPHLTGSGTFAIPGGLSIGAPRPHPVQGRAFVEIELRDSGIANVSLHDLAGKRVRTLYDGWMLPGKHQLEIDHGTHTPGVYMLLLRTTGGGTAQRMIAFR